MGVVPWLAKVGEWVKLIDLCEKRGVRIAVTTHGPRIYDPANPRDRRTCSRTLWTRSTSRRRCRCGTPCGGCQRRRGRPHGRAPFGYRRVYDESTGKLDNWAPEPAEAAPVVEAFERIAAGDSLRNVANDLAARGVAGAADVRSTPGMLRPMLLAPLYAGLRAHSPGVERAKPSQRQRHTSSRVRGSR